MTPDGLDEHFYFGGGGGTSITPIGICILILASLLILVLRRKFMIIPFLVACLLMPISQTIVVLGAHLMIYRLLIFVAWIRIAWKAFITKNDPFPSPMNLLDKVFVYWALCNATIYTILWREMGAFVNRLGFLYTSIGTYFLLRYLIRNRDDIIRTIKVFSIVLIPIALGMWIEHSTGRNPFAILGGVEEFSSVRSGAIRAQGPFLHSIVAGTFGAIQLPLFVALWMEGKGNRLLAGLGVVSSTVMTIASASSTPVISYAAGVVGLCFWPMRRSMRTVRWITIILLLTIQVFMQAPIWFLMNRLGGIIGGTGWHRSELIDQFVRRFFEWWLIGTRNNAYWGLDMWDSINAYVRAGVDGGLLTFLLFIALFVVAYKKIGVARSLSEGDIKGERLMWALGSTLFANTVAFFGIIYFDQSAIGWYAVLVMISVMTASIIESKQAQPDLDFAYPLAQPARVQTAQVRPTVKRLPTYAKRLKYQ